MPSIRSILFIVAVVLAGCSDDRRATDRRIVVIEGTAKHTRPSSDEAATQQAATQLAATTRTPNGTPWVTGYYLGYFWNDELRPEDVDMSTMTHFVFARVAPGSGTLGGKPGTIRLGAVSAQKPGGMPGSRLSVERYLVRRAHASGTKALLMIGGMGDGDGFLRSSADDVRPQFVRTLVDYLVSHNYDGVDVDWEDSLDGSDAVGVNAREARRRLIALLDDIRVEAATRPRFGAVRPILITFPGYAVSINALDRRGRVEPWRVAVAARVDQYNLMSYGIGTAYTGGGLHSWFSGPLSGASGTTPYDLTSSIAAYERSGVPRAKLGIGIGLFGIYWGPPILGPREPTDDRDEIFETDDVALRYSELVRMGYTTNGTYRWDDAAQVGYRTYAPSGYVPAGTDRNPAGFLSYEDERSIAAKGRWVREMGLGGTIVWTINYDRLPDGTSPLMAQVRRAFLQNN